MEENKKLEYAFPLTDGHTFLNDGMTLRDYFASKAIQGYMTGRDFQNIRTLDDISKASYNLADAMLKQREL